MVPFFPDMVYSNKFYKENTASSDTCYYSSLAIKASRQ